MNLVGEKPLGESAITPTSKTRGEPQNRGPDLDGNMQGVDLSGRRQDIEKYVILVHMGNRMEMT